MLFSVDKKLDFTNRNEGLTEKYALVEQLTASTASSWLLSKENGRKWLPLVRKPVTLFNLLMPGGNRKFTHTLTNL